LKIVIARSPETTVTVAAIIVIPVAPPVRCSIYIPFLPTPIRPVPLPVRSLIKIAVLKGVIHRMTTENERGDHSDAPKRSLAQ
jgi:hypothetical protein